MSLHLQFAIRRRGVVAHLRAFRVPALEKVSTVALASGPGRSKSRRRAVPSSWRWIGGDRGSACGASAAKVAAVTREERKGAGSWGDGNAGSAVNPASRREKEVKPKRPVFSRARDGMALAAAWRGWPSRRRPSPPACAASRPRAALRAAGGVPPFVRRAVSSGQS